MHHSAAERLLGSKWKIAILMGDLTFNLTLRSERTRQHWARLMCQEGGRVGEVEEAEKRVKKKRTKEQSRGINRSDLLGPSVQHLPQEWQTGMTGKVIHFSMEAMKFWSHTKDYTVCF